MQHDNRLRYTLTLELQLGAREVLTGNDSWVKIVVERRGSSSVREILTGLHHAEFEYWRLADELNRLLRVGDTGKLDDKAVFSDARNCCRDVLGLYERLGDTEKIYAAFNSIAKRR